MCLALSLSCCLTCFLPLPAYLSPPVLLLCLSCYLPAPCCSPYPAYSAAVLLICPCNAVCLLALLCLPCSALCPVSLACCSLPTPSSVSYLCPSVCLSSCYVYVCYSAVYALCCAVPLSACPPASGPCLSCLLPLLVPAVLSYPLLAFPAATVSCAVCPALYVLV